jgi:hypothetical protein
MHLNMSQCNFDLYYLYYIGEFGTASAGVEEAAIEAGRRRRRRRRPTVMDGLLARKQFLSTRRRTNVHTCTRAVVLCARHDRPLALRKQHQSDPRVRHSNKSGRLACAAAENERESSKLAPSINHAIKIKYQVTRPERENR